MSKSMLPDLNTNPPPTQYRQLGTGGLPIVRADKNYLSRHEIKSTSMVCRAGYGNFDTAKTDQTHFGRTLHEIIAKAGTGEYRVLRQLETWITDPEIGPRVMVYVQWHEYSLRDSASVVSSLDYLRSL